MAKAARHLTATQFERQIGLVWSTDEIRTGFKDHRGKTIYRKQVNIGLLPNNTSDTFPHGIVGLDVAEGAFLQIDGVVSDGTTVENLLLAANVSVVSVDADTVNVTTTGNLSSSTAIVFLSYCKV